MALECPQIWHPWCILDSTLCEHWKKTMFISINILEGDNTIHEFSQKAWGEKEVLIWDPSKTGHSGRNRSWKLSSPICAGTSGGWWAQISMIGDRRSQGGPEKLSPHSLSPRATALHWLSRSSQRTKGLVDTVCSAQPNTESGTEKAENGWGGPEQMKKSARCGCPPCLSVYISRFPQWTSKTEVSTKPYKY